MQQTSAWITVSLVLLTVSLSVALIAFLPAMIMAGGFEQNFQSDPFRPFTLPWLVFMLLFMPLSAWLTAGAYNVALVQIRGGYVKPDDLFRAGRAFWRILGYSILLGLPTYILPDDGWVWGSLFTLILSARLLFTVPLILDRDVGIWEGMRVSWHALRGQWVSSIGFLIVCGLAAASGLLLLGVGIVLTLPLAYLPFVVLYRRFFPDTQPSTVSPELSDSDFRT